MSGTMRNLNPLSPRDRHCETCECGVALSIPALNGRVRRLLEEGKINPTHPLSPELAARLDSSGVYAFGMRPFIPSSCTSQLVGAVLVAVRPDGPCPQDPEAQRRWKGGIRFFSALVPAPGGSPHVCEYSIGSAWDISAAGYDLLYMEDLGRIAAMSDDEVCAWIVATMDKLHTFVESAIVNANASADATTPATPED